MSDVPDFGGIRAFVAVAEARSFVAAARKLGLSRSALGKAIVRLETRLSTRLLHRTTRQVTLTAEGTEYLRRTQRILIDLAEAEASIRQDRPVPKGVLKLSLPNAYGRLRVLPVLKRFLESWPDLSAEVGFTDRPVDLVAEGIDLAVRIGSTASSADLVGRVIARSTIVLCAAPTYLERRGIPRLPNDLARHDRLHFGTGGGSSMRWRVGHPEGEPVLVVGPGRVLLDSAEAIRDMVLGGFGIAELPRFLVQDDLESGSLVPVLEGQAREAVPISVLYPNRHHLAVRARLFIDRLASELGDE